MGRACGHVEAGIAVRMDVIASLSSLRSDHDAAFAELVGASKALDQARHASREAAHQEFVAEQQLQSARQLVFKIDQREDRIIDRLAAENRALSQPAG